MAGPREACGIFGVYAPGEDVARLAFFALFALQHRGQESAGIATAANGHLRVHTSMGLVSQAFDEEALSRLTGDLAIGHNRYSTTGSSFLANAQPLLVEGPDGELALAHNGNIVNALALRQELTDRGHRFITSTDSEVIAQLIAFAPRQRWIDKVHYAMNRLHGAYSLVLLTPEGLMGVRDPLGVRPLCLGHLNGGWVLASESCALDHIGARYLREVEPGEVILINADGLESHPFGQREKRALCVFEYIYFARPDSILNGQLIYPVREAMGRRLAEEYPVAADLVIGVPDSATAAGIGYARGG